MENKTILDILQKKKELGSFADGDKLYSPCLGNCILVSTNDYCVVLAKDFTLYPSQKMQLRNDGRLFPEGEVMCFPSEKMREWDKFSWEKYTLLKSNKGKPVVFFDEWADDDYTKFKGILFRTKGGELRRIVKKYDTSKFSEVGEESAKSFYATLYLAAKTEISELEKNIYSYREVVIKIHDQILDRTMKEALGFEEGKPKSEKVDKDRAVLEELSKNASMNTSQFSLPTKGKLYYFEDKDKKGVSYIAQFRSFSINKKVVFFDRAVMSIGHKRVVYGDMSRKCECCLNFREATDAEENKLERVIEELKNSLVNFIEGNYYIFSIEDNFYYFGKLVSFKADKSNFTLCEVYCARRGNNPQYFKEKKFITSHCKNLRIATTEDKYFFDGVRAAYDETRKDSYQFKPKDWCLMRNDDDAPWELCQYAYDGSNEADSTLLVAIGGNSFHQCIPYDGNEQLLGTPNSPDDGAL